MTTRTTLSLLLLLFALTVSGLYAADTLVVNDWLVAGPLAMTDPLFADSAYKPEHLIDKLEPDFRDNPPREQGRFLWSMIDNGAWERNRKDTLKFRTAGASPYAFFAASYIVSSQRQEIPVKIRAGFPVAAWFDGKLVGKQTTQKDKSYELAGSVDAHTGSHLLLVKCIGMAEVSPTAWTLTATLMPDSTNRGTIDFSTTPHRAMSNFADWGLFQELVSTTVSADGKYAAVVRSERNEKYKKSSWIEIYDTKTKSLSHSIRPLSGLGAIWFMPSSPVLVYTLSGEDGSGLWAYDLNSHETRTLLEKVKGLDHVVCSPDEKFLYYAQDEETKDDERGYRLLDEIEDRVADFSRQRRIFEYAVESRVARPLNELGTFAINDFALARDGKRLAFTRQIPRVGRPYYDTELWTYNLQERQAEMVATVPLTETMTNLCWLPGGTQIAYSAGGYPSVLGDTVFHNVNQQRLFIADIRTKQIRNLSEHENFSIAQGGRTKLLWNDADNKLYFIAEELGKIHLFRCATQGAPKFERIKLSRPLIDQPAIAANGKTLAFTASSPTQPFSFFCYEPVSGKESLLLDPNQRLLSDFTVSRVEDWEFTNSLGQLVDGWLYFPPNFDPAKKYPTVVYFYGGVSPRDERFSFGYHWLTANGYVVYVLNPGGCVGYGQEFADVHSNDWGTRATQDVIDATKHLLAEKPYIDAAKLAAFGGSYGGFITLDLATKTDMFAALCDMYGISNISSYWGAGTWGYLYGDLALPGSLPWKNREIFVEKSPLYHADKIKTPLLIMHGEADNNVPPQESDQMFVAMKVLGKDVAYVRFADETHNINVKFENLIAHREMMLEWFDKYLKNQPEGWSLRWKVEK